MNDKSHISLIETQSGELIIEGFITTEDINNLIKRNFFANKKEIKKKIFRALVNMLHGNISVSEE